MRIGLVTGEYPPMIGGVGAYTHILAQEMVRQGHHVFVLSDRRAQSQNDIPTANTIRTWNLGALRAIRRWAVENEADIINLQFQTAAFNMSPWIHFVPEARGKIPVVTTFHDLRFPYLFPKAGRLRDWIVMRLAQKSDGVIVTNQEDRARLRHLPKASLIPIGSNILKILPAEFDAQIYRTQIGAKTEDFLITYFGLWNRSKGIEILLEAVANLQQKAIPIRLVLIGGLGASDPTNAAYAEEIHQLIQKYALQSVIHEVGYLDEAEVGAYLAASDAVALPYTDGASYRRGSLMAAVQYKTAIVTTIPQTRIPAFKDGENMLLVAPEDTDALEEALLRLHKSSELRNHLREGTTELSRLFDWSHIAQDTIDYFRWVIEESV
jgi:glycosyltransferase involved in cell wall biosynthesis